MDEKGRQGREPILRNDLQGILIPMLALAIIGSMNIFSATYIESITTDAGLLGYFPKHVFFLLFSIAVGIGLYHFDYRRLQKRSVLSKIMIATLAMLVLVLIVGADINGARRWIVIGPVSIQPSEFAKLSALIWTSAILTKKPWKNPEFKSIFQRKRRMTGMQAAVNYFKERIIYMLHVLMWPIIFAGVTMKQPDMGTSVLIVGFTYLLIFLAGFDKAFFAGSLIVSGALGFCMARFSTYRWERVMAWQDPWLYAQDLGYQTVQGLIAIGSGGFLGQGFMTGTAKYFYLPEAHTDFAFAIWAQEMGFIGALSVIVLVAIFTYFGFRIASKARDDFGKWLAIGITMLISGQAFFNIAMVSNLVPVTGVPLPFISYGGSSLLMNCMAIGILANISRRSIEGVKSIGKKETLPSLREETRSRFKPKE